LVIKRGVNHGQGYGQKERREKETGQDIGRKAGCEEGKKASPGVGTRCHCARCRTHPRLPGRQTTRERRPPRAKSWILAAISSRQRCRASRAAHATWGVRIKFGIFGSSKGSSSGG